MLAEYIQNIMIILIFLGVITAIAPDVIDMLVAALLGVSVLIFAGIFTQQDILNVTRVAGGPLALLFGGMVGARILVPTGLFGYIGSRYVLLTQGSGKRFLLSLFLLVGPLCAVLPHATTVILLAPIILRTAIINQQFGRLAHPGGGPRHLSRGQQHRHVLHAISPEDEPGGPPGSSGAPAPLAVAAERRVPG